MVKHMKKTYLGVEFGSTRIKMLLADEQFATQEKAGYSWKSSLENGFWTYSLEEVQKGLISVLRAVPPYTGSLSKIGISAMMHGYLAFDKDWHLLTPFRTWQNTVTAKAAAILSDKFGFNIPQRWSIAHLYQSVLNGESHINRIAHITTLSGYVHYRLTGENVLGLGDASGMFPVDCETLDFDERMLDCFRSLCPDVPWDIREILPRVLPAGADAGRITPQGAAFAGGYLPVGLAAVPPEGDSGTGMVASGTLLPGQGSISAGTSAFAMVVLKKPLCHAYPQIDVLTTPEGLPLAMIHTNCCTGEMNAWVGLFSELLSLFGVSPDMGDLFAALYRKSLEGTPDCGGLTVAGLDKGEPLLGLESGFPLLWRPADGRLTLADFVKAQLYSSVCALQKGFDLLRSEQIKMESFVCQGGYFTTPGVGQRYFAALSDTPAVCYKNAGEGGAFGMMTLAAFADRADKTERLSSFVHRTALSGIAKTEIAPDPELKAGMQAFFARYSDAIRAEKFLADKSRV